MTNEGISLSLAGHVDAPEVAAVLLRASGTPREGPRLQTGLTYAQGVALAKSGGVAIAKALASSATDPALLEHLAKDSRKAVRQAVIGNAHTPADALELIAERALNRIDDRDTAYAALAALPTQRYLAFLDAHGLRTVTKTHEIHAANAASRGADELRLALYSDIPQLTTAAARRVCSVTDNPPPPAEIEAQAPELITNVLLGYAQNGYRHTGGFAWTAADAETLVRAQPAIAEAVANPPGPKTAGKAQPIYANRLPLTADAAHVLWDTGYDYFRLCVAHSRIARGGEITRLVIAEADARYLRAWITSHAHKADSFVLHSVLRSAIEGGLERESVTAPHRSRTTPTETPLGKCLSVSLWRLGTWLEDDVLVPLLAYASNDVVKEWLSGEAPQKPEAGQVTRVAAVRAQRPSRSSEHTWSAIVAACDRKWSSRTWRLETVNTLSVRDLDHYNRYSTSAEHQAFADLVTYYLGDLPEAWQTMLTLIKGWQHDFVTLLETVCATLSLPAPQAPWAVPPKDPPVQLTVEPNGQVALLL